MSEYLNLINIPTHISIITTFKCTYIQYLSLNINYITLLL